MATAAASRAPSKSSAALPRAARVAAKWFVRLAPTLAALLALGLVAGGRLRGLRTVGWLETLGVAALAAALVARGARRVRLASLGLPVRLTDDLELGALLVGAAYLTVEVLGSVFHPIIYLLMAFLVGFIRRRVGAALLAVALVFEAARLGFSPPHRWGEFALHASFLALFAALYYLVLAAQGAKAQAEGRAAYDRKLREIDSQARAYRLGTSKAEEKEQDRRKLQRISGVREVEAAVAATMDVAVLALRPHTCAVFVLSPDGASFALQDFRSASKGIQREPFPSAEGILGAVAKRLAPIRVCGPIKGVTYYESAPRVRSLVAVPILERRMDEDGAVVEGAVPLVRGVIVADRLVDEPFGEADERLLTTLAGDIQRAIDLQRVVTYAKSEYEEKTALYKAIDKLNQTRLTSEAVTAAVEEAQRLGSFDFVALTLVAGGPDKVVHRVAKVASAEPALRELEGLEFPDNANLVANAVRYGSVLPRRDAQDMEQLVVFESDKATRGYKSIKVLPLEAGKQVLGTLCIGARKRYVLNENLVSTLRMLAIQIAQSLERAYHYDQMERMATTDGLTGLLNHRTMQAKFDELLQLASRYEKKLTFLLTDIDHFKHVNDTYGHPVGDVVLKGVAEILRSTARDTDIVARYGGEEFCVIMPETDGAGAKVMAERIRKAVEARVFASDQGPLQVTLSLGIACFPEAGRQKQQLIDLADQCLYFAKRNGRNRSVTVGEMRRAA